MTNAVVTINGAQPALPTLLGQGPVRIPTGGKIRAGIKVLTKKAAEHPKAKAIYERGVSANHSFETIERAISEAVPELKTPLIPHNVPWFTVRPDDFPNPEIAKEILAAYGEDRGDGAKRLYRFPVVFPADMWQAVMPHELIAWGANEKKFWSEYAPDGRVRYCKCYAPVPMDHTGKRAIRIFGGRKTTLRQENGGLVRSGALQGVPEPPVQPVGPLHLLHPRHQIDRRFRAAHEQLLRDERGDPEVRDDRLHARRAHLGVPRREADFVLHHQDAQGSTAHRRSGARSPCGALDHRPRGADRRHRAVANQ